MASWLDLGIRGDGRRVGLNVRDVYERVSQKKPYRLGLWIACCLPFVLLSSSVASSAPVASPTPPGVVIDHISKQSMEYIGSPSIVILPNCDYVSSHDLFRPKSNESMSGETDVFRSRDRGLTWVKIAELHDQFWSNLFVLHRKLCLMGSSPEYGRVVIWQSPDGGSTWTSPSSLTSGSGSHTAPVPIVRTNDRVWRAMEFHPTGPWGHFEAFVLSAPENSNLLDSKNWSMTERFPYPKDESVGDTWLESSDWTRRFNSRHPASRQYLKGGVREDGWFASRI